MYRLIVVIGVIFTLSPGLKAQEPADFNTINKESYRLFLAGEWDSVIMVGKTALKQDIDYYYLRMRMGIAFHEKKNFRKAACHFEKALDFNPGDPVAMEYLYYATILGGQTDLASLVREEFQGDLALKLSPSRGKFVDRLNVEYLHKQGLNSDLLADPDPLFEGLPPGVQYITRHYSVASLSLSNFIIPGFRLNHTFSYLSKTNQQYYNDGQYVFQFTDQHVAQYQYYLSPVITTRSGTVFMPMIHLVSFQYQAPAEMNQGYQGGSSQVMLEYLKGFDFATGLGFSKGFGTLNLQMGAWYATLNNMEQVQNRLGVTWYPFGNLNLYAGGYLNSQYEMAGSRGVVRIIPEINVGLGVAGKVWLDLNGAFGEMTNYLERNGLVVFNGFAEVINKKITMTLSFPVTEKGSLLYLGGRWTANESRFYAFEPSQEELTNNINYNAISIYGGITWKF
ncbi:MAG: hypothetical protein V2B15_07055 [Bacteroidota bacterium]